VKLFSALAQVFKNPSGTFDLGRIMAAKSLSAYSVAFLYSVFELHQVPEWSNLGIGYAAVMAGAGAFIGAKDIAVAKANSTPTAPTD
jgi:hypothetical protein